MSDDEQMNNELREIADVIPNVPIAPAHGIAAIALGMAMKYHDMGMIKDGALYQQYKLEGRNISTLHLDMVFETAIKIERHLMASSPRIAGIVIDALEEAVAEGEDFTAREADPS